MIDADADADADSDADADGIGIGIGIGIELLNQATITYPARTKAWIDARFKAETVEHGAALGVGVEVVTKDLQVNGFGAVNRRWGCRTRAAIAGASRASASAGRPAESRRRRATVRPPPASPAMSDRSRTPGLK